MLTPEDKAIQAMTMRRLRGGSIMVQRLGGWIWVYRHGGPFDGTFEPWAKSVAPKTWPPVVHWNEEHQTYVNLELYEQSQKRQQKQ
jgi:hypothetical protein